MRSSKKVATVNDVIEIGGRRYIVDPRGDGRVDRPPHAREHMEAQEPTPNDYKPGHISAYGYREWVHRQERAPLQPRSARPYCLNYPCPKTPLLGRKYCSNRCRYSHQKRVQRAQAKP